MHIPRLRCAQALLVFAVAACGATLASAAPPVAEGAPRHAPEDWRLHRWSISLAGHGGFFGLVNIDEEFTPQSPAAGLSSAAELRVHRYVHVGAEVMLTWMKSKPAHRHRLVISPHVRGRAGFELGRGFSMHVILAAGLTVWPEDDSEQELHPAMTPTRVGWSLRAMAGVAYAVHRRWSLVLDVGYYASSTFAREVSATLDCMLVSLGVSFRP